MNRLAKAPPPTVTISRDLYDTLVDYMDDRAEADYDEGAWVPSLEMRLWSRLQERE